MDQTMHRLRGLSLLALATMTASMAHAQMNVAIVTGNSTPVAGGAAFSYTIVATNTSALPVNFSLSDALPPSIVFQSVAVVGANNGSADCVGPANGTNGYVTCSNPNFAGLGMVTITIVAQVVPDVASGVRTNTVNVYPRTAGQLGPATASVQQNVQVSAPLSIAMSAAPTAGSNAPFSFLVSLTNQGPTMAINVNIEVELPANSAFHGLYGTPAFISFCRYRPATHTVNCPFADLLQGTHEMTIVMQAPGKQGMANATANIVTAGTGTTSVGSANAGTMLQKGQ